MFQARQNINFITTFQITDSESDVSINNSITIICICLSIVRLSFIVLYFVYCLCHDGE